MTERIISTPQEALALANTINPGGQRLLDDGSVSAGLPRHETNCALVALATAAFLKDGTEVGAPSAPSALLFSGNKFLVNFVIDPDSEKIPKDKELIVVDYDDELRFFDDAEFQATFNPQSVIDSARKILEEFQGRSMLVHGITENAHHWFNVTPQGQVVDIQVGQSGDQLLVGQIADGEIKRFTKLEFYPVDPTISGAELIENTQAMHQFNSMVDLARFLQKEIDVDYEIPLNEFINNITNAHVDYVVAKGGKETAVVNNEKTSEWFNAFAHALREKFGDDKLSTAFDKALDRGPNDGLIGEENKTWLSEATFREPGSIEKSRTVVEEFADRCPDLKLALDRQNQVTKNAAPENRAALDR